MHNAFNSQMNPKEDLLCSGDTTTNKICPETQAMQLLVDTNIQQPQIPEAGLKRKFQDILFNPKYKMGAVFLKSSNSVSLSSSISVSDSSSTVFALHYEDYQGLLHAILSKEDIEGLRSIAEKLNQTGFVHECVQAYADHRKEVVNKIYGQVTEELNIEAVHGLQYWEQLNKKIQRWIQAANAFRGTIFVMEKSFFEQVFGGLSKIMEEDYVDCLVRIIGDAAAKLFEFPASLTSASSRLPERLDMFLPLYKALLDLILDLNVLFQKDISLASNINICANEIACHVMKILSASEHHVLGELSMIPIPGGTIHPLTKYVLRYVNLVCKYENALADVIPKQLIGDQGFSSLRSHLIRIVEFLLSNLTNKSNFYKQESLRCLFMINNVHHIAHLIKSSQGIHQVIGNNFPMKLTEQIEQDIAYYLNTTWGRVCDCLTNKGAKSLVLNWSFFSAGKSRRANIKLKFKTFNVMFEDVCQSQLAWSVPDPQLRQRIQQSILDKLIPAYSQFLGQMDPRVEKVRESERYMKYSVHDLKTKVLSLFKYQVLV